MQRRKGFFRVIPRIAWAAVIKKTILTVSAIAVLAAGICLPSAGNIWPAAASRARMLQEAAASLGQGVHLPGMAAQICLQENITGFTGDKRMGFLRQAFSRMGMNIQEPTDMMGSHFQLGALGRTLASGPAPVPVSAETPPEGVKGLVAFYCTHSAETYFPDDNCSHRRGERGLVNEVAATLSDEMERRGFCSVCIKTVHDSPDYNLSYARSRETVKQLLAEQQGWMAIIDVHRDSIPENNSPAVVEVKGKKAAQILLLVGSDQRRSNPCWQVNQELANLLMQSGQARYPGLIRAVRVKPGTYNQDLYSPSLLIEVGNEYNSLEQAKYSACLFADILAGVLEGEDLREKE